MYSHAFGTVWGRNPSHAMNVIIVDNRLSKKRKTASEDDGVYVAVKIDPPNQDLRTKMDFRLESLQSVGHDLNLLLLFFRRLRLNRPR